MTSAQAAVSISYLAAAVWYLSWRSTSFNPDAPAFSILLFGAELLGLIGAALHVFMAWRLARRAVAMPLPGLAVDVFVTAHGEPIAMLRRTLLAAREIDYTHRTWLLDGAGLPQRKALAEELGVRYLAPGSGEDGKAGALNHALSRARGDFLAIFNGDQVPARHFLTRTLGFFRDESVAFVQTPEDLTDLDFVQQRTDRCKRLVQNERSIFQRVVQPGKDYWNAGLLSGGCAVLRRTALEPVGGFAAGTQNEDLHTSLRLHKQGYKSVYLSESLALRISPCSLMAFIEKQTRRDWGTLQVWAKEGIVLCSGLTLPQRASYLASMLASLEGWRKAVIYFAPAVILLTGTLPIAAVDAQFLLHFVPFIVLSLWCFEEVGRGYGRIALTEQIKMARFAALFTAVLDIGRNRDPVAPAREDGSVEMNSARLIWPLGAVLALNLVAIPFGVAQFAAHQTLPAGALAASGLWALLNAGLAAAVLCATLKTVSFRRAEDRFPLPLPARLKFPVDEPVYGMVDSLSSSGFRFYGRFPEYAQFGAKVSGELYLPGGALPLQATIRSFYLGHEKRGEPQSKSVGLSFDVVQRGDEAVLEHLLRGPDPHWRVTVLTGRGETPLGLLARVLGGGVVLPAYRPERWAPALFQGMEDPHGRPQVGMICLPARGAAPLRVIGLAPAPVGTRLRIRVAASNARQCFEGVLEDPQVLDTPLAPIYAYSFAIDGRTQP